MALHKYAVAFALIVTCSPVAAQRILADVYNNTLVDLCVEEKAKLGQKGNGTRIEKHCTTILPKQVGRVLLRQKQWINFGAQDLEYRLPLALFSKSRKGAQVLKFRVESGGRLYVVPSGEAFSIFPLPFPPDRFPVIPVRVVELI